MLLELTAPSDLGFYLYAMGVVLFLTGFWSWPYETQHINDGLQEKLEDCRHRVGAELCGDTAVSHK